MEDREFARLLTAADVPGTAIRVEDQSAGTWQNAGLPLPCVHALRTLLPEADPFYAISWEPLYPGVPVTRTTGPTSRTAGAG